MIIKLKAQFLIGICILFLLSVPVVISEAYAISIVNKTYELSDTSTKGTQTASYYDILITIKNQGVSYTDDITVELVDEFDIPTTKNYTFQPSEIKTFQFKEYPVVGTGQKNITIRYYPSNESRINQGNSGSTFLIIGEIQQQSSTPFLPTVIFICLILFFAYYRKKHPE
jgi:hypothetical protein